MGSLLGPRIRLALGVCLALAGAWFVYTVRGILAPFILAFIFAYVLTPLVDRMEARGVKRTPSILLIFLLAFSMLAVLVITAGQTMTGQMIELSSDFLRQESRDVTLTVENLSERRVYQVSLSTVGEGENNPFEVVEPADGVLILQPAAVDTVVLRFAPASNDSAWGELQVRQNQSMFPVALVGNHEGGMREFDGVKWGELALSSRGLDFGSAGPNVMSQISTQVAAIEPQLEAIAGKDIDVAALVKTYGSQLIDVLLGRTTQLVSGVVSGLMLVVIVPFVSFFFLKEGRRITHGLIELVPNQYFEITLNLMHSINNSIGGYIRGQLLAVSVVACLSVSGLYIIGMSYALPVGVIAGLANMIPYLGPLIGIISASVVAIATAGGTTMVTQVVILFLFIQIIDNVLVQPIVVAKSVDLHPLVVMIVVMIGSDLWGMVGMLVAVPVTGILKVSAVTVYEGLKGYRT